MNGMPSQPVEEDNNMKVGIIGAGNIGATIARKLVAAGHEIKLANSKGPESLQGLARDIGAIAVSKEDAVVGVDAVILSIPFAAYQDMTSLFSKVPADVVVIDTSNYYPFRDGVIDEVVNGTPESVWSSGQIARPVVKAWNALLAETLVSKGEPAGAPSRLAIPVAGDDAKSKAIALSLVEATGFDAVDVGSLVDSWRQQPGTPAYCTELKTSELKRALEAADKSRAPKNRDALMDEFMSATSALTHEHIVTRNRAVTAAVSL